MIADGQKIKVPENINECSVLQYTSINRLSWNVRQYLGLIPMLPPLGSPNHEQVKIDFEGFKELPKDENAITEALLQPANLPLFSVILNISIDDVKILYVTHRHLFYRVFVVLAGVRNTVNAEMLNVQEGRVSMFKPSQGIVTVINGSVETLKMYDSLEDYATIICNTAMDTVTSGYDITAFLDVFIGQLLRKSNDKCIIFEGAGNAIVNPVFDTYTASLANCKAVDLINLYLFFCQYTKIVRIWLSEVSVRLKAFQMEIQNQVQEQKD